MRPLASTLPVARISKRSSMPPPSRLLAAMTRLGCPVMWKGPEPRSGTVSPDGGAGEAYRRCAATYSVERWGNERRGRWV